MTEEPGDSGAIAEEPAVAEPQQAEAAGADKRDAGGLRLRRKQEPNTEARLPEGRPYLVLPIYDDGPALYRSIGPGMGVNVRGSTSCT